MKNALIPVLLGLIFLSSAWSADNEKKLLFTPIEVESMLYLFNQTQIKGSDVEVIAPLQSKLKNSFEMVKAQSDSSSAVEMDLTTQQMTICYHILKNANFEAKYTELIYGMMNKLKQHIPPGALQPMSQP